MYPCSSEAIYHVLDLSRLSELFRLVIIIIAERNGFADLCSVPPRVSFQKFDTVCLIGRHLLPSPTFRVCTADLVRKCNHLWTSVLMGEERAVKAAFDKFPGRPATKDGRRLQQHFKDLSGSRKHWTPIPHRISCKLRFPVGAQMKWM